MSREGKVTREGVEKLAMRTGLSKSTIRDLLERGWTWEDKLNEVPRFVHPISQVMRIAKQ